MTSKLCKGNATRVSPPRLLYPVLGTEIQEKRDQLGGVDIYANEGSLSHDGQGRNGELYPGEDDSSLQSIRAYCV